MTFEKEKPWRNKKYLKWVSSQPCYLCGAPADEAHHITGIGNLGGMGLKAPDQFTIPTCRGCHRKWHEDWTLLELQWEAICKTMASSIKEGFFKT